MNRTWIVGLLVALACGAAYSSDSQMTAKKFQIDEQNEEVSADGMRLVIKGLGAVEARKSVFRLDGGELPRVMELEDVRVTNSNLSLIQADKAVFYPHVRVMSASRFTIGSATTADDSYTCHNGQLRNNGTAVSGNKACHNDGGGGSIQVSCVGDYVNLVFLDQQCPVE